MLTAVSAGLAGAVVVLSVLLLLRRSPREADDGVASAVRDLNARIDDLARDVTRVLARTDEQTRRAHALAELAARSTSTT